MITTWPYTLLKKDQLSGGFKLKLHPDQDITTAELIDSEGSNVTFGSKGRYSIRSIEIKGLYPQPWTYDSLPDFARRAIDQFLEQHGTHVLTKKNLKRKHQALSASDGLIPPPQEVLATFSRTGKVNVEEMTFPSFGSEGALRNIKGSDLIEIVHKTVYSLYGEAVNFAYTYEKELGGPLIQPPHVENNILFIESIKDWIISMGGWKSMAPKGEIPHYAFARDASEHKFLGVKIHGMPGNFPIDKDGRIHIDRGFSIQGYPVTRNYRRAFNQWVPIEKTDLSYTQIVRAISHMKKAFNWTDAVIAKQQLLRLENPKAIEQFAGSIDKQTLGDITRFLDYLNALMFGIEASGLNAAMLTSLMTLDLIVRGKLSYSRAFSANQDGGVYPYACYGDNRGTYIAREEILRHKKRENTTLSMGKYRKDLSYSPVAVKEATLIKFWLEQCGELETSPDYFQQCVAIEKALSWLTTEYFGIYVW